MSELVKAGGLAIVALGSNLGDPRENVRQGIKSLRRFSDGPILASSLWETAPVDCPPGSPMFVNAAVAFEPQPLETPETLLAKLQELERGFGRRPKTVSNEPRPLDLDLIAFRGERRGSATLTLPHPRAAQRRFVLQPLAEIAPDLVLPGQERTVRQLLEALQHDAAIRRLE